MILLHQHVIKYKSFRLDVTYNFKHICLFARKNIIMIDNIHNVFVYRPVASSNSILLFFKPVI